MTLFGEIYFRDRLSSYVQGYTVVRKTHIERRTISLLTVENIKIWFDKNVNELIETWDHNLWKCF